MSWSNYSKEAEVGTGGDAPIVPDDLYDARVCFVSEPETKTDIFKDDGSTKTQFYIDYELLSDEVPESTTVRQYISLPPQYLENGVLGEKSTLYAVMEALGFDMDGRFKVEPHKWIDMRCRVMTEQKDGKFAKVTAVKPARQKAAAGARNGGGLKARLTEE